MECVERALERTGKAPADSQESRIETRRLRVRMEWVDGDEDLGLLVAPEATLLATRDRDIAESIPNPCSATEGDRRGQGSERWR